MQAQPNVRAASRDQSNGLWPGCGSRFVAQRHPHRKSTNRRGRGTVRQVGGATVAAPAQHPVFFGVGNS